MSENLEKTGLNGQVVDDQNGASANERLLFSAKQDSEEVFLELESQGGYDINFKDGLGNTALHYAVIYLSPTVLELILEHEGADVDLINNQGLTPLHCAIQIKEPKPRLLITKSLLEAGADTRIKNKHNQRPIDMIPTAVSNEIPEDRELRKALKEAEAEQEIGEDEIAKDEFDDDDVASEDE
ncbi:ankyrin repeat-containing domain protein [Phakopsora pachyrhizi]|nr:ankyrin repeat-containing domain protein [Phakopsora pachyrhizi]